MKIQIDKTTVEQLIAFLEGGQFVYPRVLLGSLRAALTAAPAEHDHEFWIGVCESLDVHARKDVDFSRCDSNAEPKLPEFFCGVDIDAAMNISVSVLQRRVDDVAVLIHSETLPIPLHAAPAEPVEANNDEVICPNCCTQFRAIPVNVQKLMLDAGFEPPFKGTRNVSTPAEPVAWVTTTGIRLPPYVASEDDVPMYYAPQPQREPLTDGEIYTAYIKATNQTLRPQDERLALAFARAIEKALK